MSAAKKNEVIRSNDTETGECVETIFRDWIVIALHGAGRVQEMRRKLKKSAWHRFGAA